MPNLTKSERLRILIDELGQQPSASSYEEAFGQLVETLNKVEDEHSGVPYNPENWKTDGRMYPPQSDNIKQLEGTSIMRLVSVGNTTYISRNGAIQIWTRPRDGSAAQLLFSKAGSNGEELRVP